VAPRLTCRRAAPFGSATDTNRVAVGRSVASLLPTFLEVRKSYTSLSRGEGHGPFHAGAGGVSMERPGLAGDGPGFTFFFIVALGVGAGGFPAGRGRRRDGGPRLLSRPCWAGPLGRLGS